MADNSDGHFWSINENTTSRCNESLNEGEPGTSTKGDGQKDCM